MRAPTSPIASLLASLVLLAFVSAPAFAQNSSQNGAQRAPDKGEQLSNKEQKNPRVEQRTERIHLEDQGSTVDELRIGGQTRSITVQPAAGNMPSYEVLPSDGVRNRPQNGSESTTGPRVWNVMKF
ncbi:MAG: hypothetical protein KBF40_09745 [Giesbergeria sp.]|jgi:hypothetical protein|nr:hypothetical protein [Giesbergeria sp.]MBP6159710.1 hypothetical protein [Giesbergeria sp.]MBP7083083.1 hypothetical protein [Giesbergeria sp.]MBP9784292.1 hypothetical protein [Giesbergeria sp.]MBP9895611.1 hypothetical protein [Giesbergeria sp.]